MKILSNKTVTFCEIKESSMTLLRTRLAILQPTSEADEDKLECERSGYWAG
jgi:hypothetical protein